MVFLSIKLMTSFDKYGNSGPLDMIRHQAKRFQSDRSGEEGPSAVRGKAHPLMRGKEEAHYMGVLQAQVMQIPDGQSVT